MAATGVQALRKLQAAKLALANAVVAGCEEYANGGNRGEPIVRRHFTAGDEGRYGWQPLSDGYAKWKAGGTVATTGGGAFLNRKQRGALDAKLAGFDAGEDAQRMQARAAKRAAGADARAAKRAAGVERRMAKRVARAREAADRRAHARAVKASERSMRRSDRRARAFDRMLRRRGIE